MSVEEKIKQLNIEIPKSPKPVGAYVAFRIINKLVYISGQISFDQNGNLIKGKVGSELSLEQGQEAAKACAINIISQLKSACEGDLEKVKSCIKINGYVNSTDNFLSKTDTLEQNQKKTIEDVETFWKKFQQLSPD